MKLPLLRKPEYVDLRQFDEGFGVFERVIDIDECQNIITSLSVTTRSVRRAGLRNLMDDPAVQKIACDERMLRIAKEFVGDTAIPYKATLFEKSGNANWFVVWHQDTALPLSQRFESSDWGPWSVKERVKYAHAPAYALSRIVALRLHLDDSTETNGPLRVIPGSHHFGVLNDTQVLDIAHENNPVTCLSSAGGVIAMRPLTVHSSSKAVEENPRRVLHIEYADTLHICDKADLVLA